jgi:uncharacterized protein YceK
MARCKAVGISAWIFFGWVTAQTIPAQVRNDHGIGTNDWVAPVYVTIAAHIEDTAGYASQDAYPEYRAKLLEFAEMLSRYGVACNLQIDYEFLFGTVRWETEAMRAETGGTNVIAWLQEHYGFEIDAHQEGGVEEGLDNYADVRFLGGQLTPAMSEIVGGMVWDDPQQFARLANGEPGQLYPHFTWRPEVLTLAVSHLHHSNDFSLDDVASGVWQPRGANTDFWVHTPAERMICVGPGEHTDWGREDEHLSSPEFVKHLASALQAGTIPSNRMYTVTLAVPQSVIFDSNQYSRLTAKLDEIAPCIRSGRAQYVAYSEAVAIWTNRFGGQANIYFRDPAVPDLPLVDTAAISSITASNAAGGGEVVWDGGATVTNRGICWSRSANPTLADSHTGDESGTGCFSSAISGLDPETGYHVRAFAATSNGIGYGPNLAFTSAPSILPVPDIKANGSNGTVRVAANTTVSVAIALYPGEYAGAEADWWVVAAAPFGAWYYLDGDRQWAVFDGNLAACRPAYQGPLFDLPSTAVLDRYLLPPGNYIFYFAVDQRDSILNYPCGPILFDAVTIVVQ